MSRRHPESIFSSLTWKGEDGNGGLRNLYGTLAYLLAENHLARNQERKTYDQAAVRRKAAERNFQRLYVIGAKIQNNEYVSEEERKIWEEVEYDVNKEVLRAILRAFDSTVIKAKYHPKFLDDKQSGMIEIFDYIKKHQTKIEEWKHFSKVETQLQRMGISFPNH